MFLELKIDKLPPVKNPYQQNNDDQDSIGKFPDYPIFIVEKGKAFRKVFHLPFDRKKDQYSQ